MKKILSCSKIVSLQLVILIVLVCNFNIHAQQKQTKTPKNEKAALVENQLNIIDGVIKKDVWSQIDESISELGQSKTDNSSLKSATGLAALSETDPLLAADSVILLELYNKTNGASWINNSNWLTGPVSSWYGITVVSNRVTEIKLKENNLTGTIPLELGQLTSLEYLSLDTNNLSGNIPI